MKMIILKGLPASGKTTFAKAEMQKNPELIRISMDDLGLMLFGGFKPGEANLKILHAAQTNIISSAAYLKRDIIIDNTNLNPNTLAKLQILGHNLGYQIEIKDFTDVPLGVCLERNMLRGFTVPDSVIREMHAKFLAPTKSKCVSCNKSFWLDKNHKWSIKIDSAFLSNQSLLFCSEQCLAQHQLMIKLHRL